MGPFIIQDNCYNFISQGSAIMTSTCLPIVACHNDSSYLSVGLKTS